MWACHEVTLPGVVFASSRDATGLVPGMVCVPLEEPLTGATVNGWRTGWRIAQLIEEFPF